MQKLSVVRNADAQSFMSLSSFEMSNWVLTDQRIFNGNVPSGSIDVSNCTKFKIEFECTSLGSGNVFLYFDADATATNYKHVFTSNAYGNSAPLLYSMTGPTWAGFLISHTAGVGINSLEFDKIVKSGFTYFTYNNSSNNNPVYQPGYSSYYGAAAMNTLNWVSTSNTLIGILRVYKWNNAVATNLASYQLVKEYNLNNQMLSDTLAVDGENFSEMRIVADFLAPTNAFLAAKPNGDTGTNYTYAEIYSINSAAFGSSSASHNAGLYLSNSGTRVRSSCDLSLKSGSKRVAVVTQYCEFSSNLSALVLGSAWSNTTSPVTSLTIKSNIAITGTVRVYRLVTAQLLNQLNNPLKLVINKSFTNQAVSEFLDFSDCDTIELELSSRTNFANSVSILFNNDSTAANYIREVMFTNGSVVDDYVGTDIPLLGYSGQVTQVIKATVHKGSNVILSHSFYHSADNTKYTQLQSYEWLATIPTSLVLSCVSGFTGKIKAWKRY